MKVVELHEGVEEKNEIIESLKEAHAIVALVQKDGKWDCHYYMASRMDRVYAGELLKLEAFGLIE